MSLDELLRAVQAGDPRAEQRLYRQLRIVLLPFFRNHAERSEAEDLTQQTLATVVRKLQDITFVPRGPASFRSYVFVIAHYELLSHRQAMRRLHRSRKSEISSWSAPGPDEVTMNLERDTLLRTAVAALKTSYRRALESRLRGEDPREFAHAEGIELITVRTRIHRAVALVMAEIEARRRTARVSTPT